MLKTYWVCADTVTTIGSLINPTEKRKSRNTKGNCVKMREFEIDQFVWISSTHVSSIINTSLSQTDISFWLGKIEKLSSKDDKTHHLVHLCGTTHQLSMLKENIHHLSDGMFHKTTESLILNTLIEIIEAVGLIDPKPKSTTKDPLKNNVSNRNSNAAQNPEDVTEIPSVRNGGFPQNALYWETKLACEKAKNAGEKTIKETPRKKTLTEEESDPKSSPVRKIPKHSSKQIPITETEVNQPMDDPFAAPGENMFFHFPREPSFEVSTILKIGFLGLGVMGQRIVKNLLKSGHDVSIWNRTEDKCRNLAEDGAQQCSTPSQLVRKCDVIFSCVSDPSVAKSLLFCENGILEELQKCRPGTKGYVELTSTDPSSSREIAAAIMYHGGKYLEAPMFGSEKLAEDGSLLIICSGDPELFKICESFFATFCTDLLYLSYDIGKGSMLRLAVSMLVSNVYAALLEAMSFLKKCRISRNIFLRILELISMSSPFIKVVGESILAEKVSTHISLKNQLQDLQWVLSVADSMTMTMEIACSVNEYYKHAKLLKKTGRDPSYHFFW
ncbi:putative oxidoreductase GLYR1 homolog [Trichonephila inaurata madagascariensis]|uniref:Putative oxidoreductase GLYR1 homolog n=1 Tax=Trichonephila inaurata madagascariensis TaxID=2747483 RepID=A0A8X6YIF2_9ARAC|nr:putative oxidoreductase GLYR1 homolog [Trichonephila inaurata madagascariensis]